MHLRHLSILTLSLLTALSAHATTNVTWENSKANDWHTPMQKENAATLVFIRANQSLGLDSATNIAINNRYLISLNDAHYSTDTVCAGAVQISATPTKTLTNNLSSNAINVALMPGQVQYVYIEVDNQYRPSLRAISEQDALPLIANNQRQIHQVSRTNADNCPAFLPPPAPAVTPAPTYTPPPVVSITAQPSAQEATPSMRLNIHFDHDKSVVKSEYKAEVSRAANFLAQYPTMNALVEGHTDETGDSTYNQVLSQRRAEAVRQALINNHNVNPARLRAKGYGESRPVADNTTPQGRAENRRVVISIPATE